MFALMLLAEQLFNKYQSQSQSNTKDMTADVVRKKWSDAHRPETKVFRSYFSDTLHKPLPGSHRLIAQYNPAHWKHKRMEQGALDIQPSAKDVGTSKPFDAKRFNFNKIDQAEILLRFDFDNNHNGSPRIICDSSKGNRLPHVVAVNVSPLFHGHSLVLPDPAAGNPQRLNSPGLLVALTFLKECRKSNAKMLFNSLGAFASVNHLHFHLVFLGSECPHGCAPIERAENAQLGISKSKSSVQIGCLVGWGCEAITITSKNIRDIVSATMDVVELLYARMIPFNIFISSATKLIVIPRQNEAEQLRTPGFRMAVAEVAGFCICKSDDEWDSINEREYLERMRASVSLSHTSIRDIASSLI